MFQLFITSLPLNVNAFIDWTDFARGHACHFGMRQWACSVYSSKHWVQYNSQASVAEREAIVVISLMYITFSLRVHIALSICLKGQCEIFCLNFVGWKDSTWDPHEHTNTVSRVFSFSQRYSITKFGSFLGNFSLRCSSPPFSMFQNIAKTKFDIDVRGFIAVSTQSTTTRIRNFQKYQTNLVL